PPDALERRDTQPPLDARISALPIPDSSRKALIRALDLDPHKRQKSMGVFLSDLGFAEPMASDDSRHAVIEAAFTFQYQKSAIRAFLCHSSVDKTSVRQLCRRLRSDGIDPWLDDDRLLPGQEWSQEITMAVRRSHIILICLSQNSAYKEGY